MPKPARTTFAKTRSLTRRSRKARRAGRRPTGPGGTKVSDYPHVMIRLPQATKDTLDALSGITGVPVWQLVDRAIHAFVRSARRRNKSSSPTSARGGREPRVKGRVA